MSEIKVTPLGKLSCLIELSLDKRRFKNENANHSTSPGAGQDVGRSCILLSIGNKNIMLDCGMHMGYNDDVSRTLVK